MERRRGKGEKVGEEKALNLSSPTGTSVLCSPLREALASGALGFLSLTLSKGRVFQLWRASPLLRISLSSSFPESQAFWRRATEFFLGKSHLPGEEGSLWIGDGPNPTALSRQASAPRVLQGCQATIFKLVFREWWLPRPPQQRLALCFESWARGVRIGEAGEAEEQVPGPRPAEGKGRASCGSPTLQHPGEAPYGESRKPSPGMAWGGGGGGWSPFGLGVFGTGESLLFSVILLPSFRVQLWPSALPPHLPMFKSPAWMLSPICSHTISGSLEPARSNLISWAQTLAPHLHSSHNGYTSHAQVSASA